MPYSALHSNVCVSPLGDCQSFQSFSLAQSAFDTTSHVNLSTAVFVLCKYMHTLEFCFWKRTYQCYDSFKESLNGGDGRANSLISWFYLSHFVKHLKWMIGGQVNPI